MTPHWPDWPAMMLRKTASAYCDMSVSAFEREVSKAHLPASVMLGGKPHWHRVSLDRNLERIAGMMNDWRKSSPLYNKLDADRQT